MPPFLIFNVKYIKIIKGEYYAKQKVQCNI